MRWLKTAALGVAAASSVALCWGHANATLLKPKAATCFGGCTRNGCIKNAASGWKSCKYKADTQSCELATLCPGGGGTDEPID